MCHSDLVTTGTTASARDDALMIVQCIRVADKQEVWDTRGDEVLATIKDRFQRVC